jgi:MoxR-like ATPase
MATILDRTTRGEWPTVSQVMSGDEIQKWQQLVREVLIAAPVQDYAIRLVLATHPGGDFAAADTNKYIRCGASPRGAQALVLASKVRALLEGRFNVSFEDIRKVYHAALRHRILLNFEAQAENIPTDAVLEEILKEVKEKADLARKPEPPPAAVRA